jgi:hypothetical protein
MCLNRLFSVEELEKLDEKQLAILDDAIRREIQTSEQITNILRKKLKATLYDKWVRKKS